MCASIVNYKYLIKYKKNIESNDNYLNDMLNHIPSNPNEILHMLMVCLGLFIIYITIFIMYYFYIKNQLTA